jgi:hypothetical protein
MLYQVEVRGVRQRWSPTTSWGLCSSEDAWSATPKAAVGGGVVSTSVVSGLHLGTVLTVHPPR